MKRIFIIGLAILFISGFPPFIMAQNDDSPMKDQGMMMVPMTSGAGMMGEQGMMGQKKIKGMHPMAGMMMKAMTEKTLVPTEDGGVIVLVGNKLTKYDKNLNLVKEVEIKVDTEAMRQNMMDMIKNCPMMKGMMMNESATSDQPGDEGAPTTGK
ncbi:MAG: hypothetical protein ABIJ41_01570 [Candidatus Omnitrophota bacterium]